MNKLDLRRFRLPALVCIGLLLSACDKDSPTVSAYKTWIFAFPNPFTLHDDPVLARAGNVEIRASECRNWFQRQRPAETAKSITALQRHELLEELLRRKITMQMARESGAVVDPLHRKAAEQMEYMSLMASFEKNFQVTDSDMRTFYLLHAKSLLPNEVVVSHVALSASLPTSHLRALLAEGKSVPGMKKDKVTRTSQAGREGDDTFLNSVFALPPGTVAGPMNTPWGFELIRMEKPPAQPLPPYEAVTDQIRNGVQAQKLEELYKQRLSSTKVEVDEPLLDSLDLSVPPAAQN